MAQIAPCIMAETAEQYKVAIERVQLFAKRVHVDISDGEFAPTFLLSPDQIWWPQGWQVDIHAMVMRPAEYVDKLIALNPNMIIFHAETGVNLLPIIDKIKQANIQAGLALLKQTVPSTVAETIKAVDHVMIFSGDLGKHGGTASMMQIEKVRLIKSINPDVEIGWDGGVNLENAFSIARGGVDVLNAGGVFANAESPVGTYNALTAEINKQGAII